MSDRHPQAGKPGGGAQDADDDADKPTGNINLWVVYGLMFLGLLAAIGIAMLIVFPFYQRR